MTLRIYLLDILKKIYDIVRGEVTNTGTTKGALRLLPAPLKRYFSDLRLHWPGLFDQEDQANRTPRVEMTKHHSDVHQRSSIWKCSLLLGAIILSLVNGFKINARKYIGHEITSLLCHFSSSKFHSHKIILGLKDVYIAYNFTQFLRLTRTGFYNLTVDTPLFWGSCIQLLELDLVDEFARLKLDVFATFTP